MRSIRSFQYNLSFSIQIGQLREKLDIDMAQCSGELDSDAVQDAEARSVYNESYRPLASATAAKPYWDKIASFRSTLQRAGDSDQVVMQRLTTNEAAFADLNEDTARTKMPRLQAPMVGSLTPASVIMRVITG